MVTSVCIPPSNSHLCVAGRGVLSYASGSMPPLLAEIWSRVRGARRRCAFVALALLLSGPLWGLDPGRPLGSLAQRTWRSGDGLLQDTAAALLESRDGFLWVGTEAGLMRFDGAAFEPFSRLNAPAFGHNRIQALAETTDRALWIATSEPGLYRMERGTFRAFGPAEGLPGVPIRRLLRDRAGTLWAAPVEGPLLRFDGVRFHPMPSDSALLRIRALTEGPDGTIWVGTADSGLWRLDKDHLVLAALTAAEITALEADAQGEVWVGTHNHGLLSLRDGRLEPPTWARRGLPAQPISVLRQDRQGSLWVGFEEAGLYRHAPNGRLESALPSATPHWTPVSLLEDSAGALWVGTSDRGLRVIYPVAFQGIPAVGSDPEAPAAMVCQDTAGTLWCLLGDHTLRTIRQGRAERPQLPVPPEPITCIWPRRSGGLWVGTRTGEVYILDGGPLRRVRWPNGPPQDSLLSLFEDEGGALWVATSHQGLHRLAPNGTASLYPAARAVVAMAGTRIGGPLFLASLNLGLGILEEGQVRWLGRAEGLGASGAQALHLDPEGTLWVGTPEGLRRYQEGAFQALSGPPGPLRWAIHSILEDPGHRLWLSTDQGVFRVQRAALERALDRGNGLSPALFDHHDGMPSRETSGGAQPAAWCSREGDLWFPTGRGLSRTPGGSPQLPEPPLRLHLLKAEGDETVLPETVPIHVPPGTRRFEVYYTATSLTRADKLRFRYRLEGLETTWNEVGDRRFAAYSNLPPGSYRFTVQAWRLGEEAPPQEQRLEVRVDPFLHQRPAFWAACLLAAAAFGWWLLRLRFQQVSARSAVLAERNRMAREIHDHLAQGFTGVLLQLEAAEARLGRMQGDPEPVLTRLDHARNLAVASLQEARRSVMALSPRRSEGTDLLSALKTLADRLLAGTGIQVELAQTGQPRALRPQLEDDLLRMAQELLTNALRHGHARWVRAVLRFEGRRVILTIEDDGQGFDPTAVAGGYGMRSIRETLHQLGGRMEVDSTPGFGSHITLSVPFRRWLP